MYRYKILSQLINMYPLINVGFGKFFPKNNKRVYTTIRGTRVGTYNFFLHDLAQIFPRENALRFDKWQYCVHNSVFFSVYFSKIYQVTFLKVVCT